MANVIFDCDFLLNLGKKNIEFNITQTAQVVGLFGVSGAGKTSILHAVAGLNTPVSGHITIHGKTFFNKTTKVNLPIQQRRVGLVFQDAQLFPHKSVMDNLLFGYRNISESERFFKPNDIIELLKLSHLIKRLPNKLSGGEKQRVALGRALLYSPKLLLMDEPLSALDSIHKAEILPFFEKIIQNTGVPMMYVSHDLEEIQQLTNTIHYL